jgi:hypothetical protein
MPAPEAEVASAWVGRVIGVLCAAAGGLTIIAQQSTPRLRKTICGRPDGRRHGIGLLSMAAVWWLEAVPHLADAPSVAVLGFSILAFVPLTIAIRVFVRTRRPR